VTSGFSASEETAIFRAMANFNSLISEANRSASALNQLGSAGNNVGPQVRGGVDDATGGLAGFGKKLDDIGGKLTSVGSTMTTHVTLPAVGLGAVMVRAFGGFELAITKAGSKAGATAQQMQQMSDLAQKMGAERAFSATDAAEALDNLAALGLNARDAMATLPAVMQAAQGSGTDLSTTATVVAQSLQAWSLNTGQAIHVSDVLAQTANSSATTVSGLAEAFQQAAQLGSSANQSIEEVSAAVGVLSNKGLPPAMGGTALRQAIQFLAAPHSAKAVATIKELGLVTRDASGNLLPLHSLLDNLSVALDPASKGMQKFAHEEGLSGKAARDLAVQRVFGVQGLTAVNLLLSKGKPLVIDRMRDTDQWARLQKGLNEELGPKAGKAFLEAHTKGDQFVATGHDVVTALVGMNYAADGVSKTMSDKLGNTLTVRIDNMLGSFQNLAVTIVKAVLPQLEKMVSWLQQVANHFAKFSKDHPLVTQVVVGATALVAALGPVALLLGGMARSVGSIIRLGSGLSRVVRGGSFAAAGRRGAGIGGVGGPVEVFALRPLPVEVLNMMPGGMVGRGGAPVGGAPIVPAGGSPAQRAGFLGRRGFSFGGALAGAGLIYAGDRLGAGAADTSNRGVFSSGLTGAGYGAVAGSFLGPAGAVGGAAIGAGAGLLYGLFQQHQAEEDAKKPKEAQKAASPEYLAKALATYTKAIKLSNDAHSEYAQGIAKVIVQSTDLGQTAEAAGYSQDQLAAAITGTNSQYNTMVTMLELSGQLTDDQKTKLAELRGEYMVAAEQVRRYSDARGIAMKGDQKSISGARLVTATLGGLAHAHESASTAAFQFSKSVDVLDNAVSRNGKTLDVDTAAGQANYRALKDAAGAALFHAQAVTRRTGSVQAGLSALRQDRKAILDQAQALGLDRDATQRLLDKIYQIPKNRHTQITVNGRAARQALQDILNASQLIPRQITQTITVRRTVEGGQVVSSGVGLNRQIRYSGPQGTVYAKASGGEVPGLAGGGELRGPGGPRSDRLLWPGTRVSAKEFVVNAADYRRNKAAVQQINAGRPDLAMASLSRSLDRHRSELPRALSLASPSAAGASRTVVFSPTINNPVPETSDDSLARTYAKLAYLGLDAAVG
jgi:TP901 family phage tail tape measure protein